MIGEGSPSLLLTDDRVRSILQNGLAGIDLDGKKVLVIIPDRTRTFPLPLFFDVLVHALLPRARAITFMVALGTHPPMSERDILAMTGSAPDWFAKHPQIKLVNHSWDKPDHLTNLGVINSAEMAELSEGRLTDEVPVAINREALEHDLAIICGPVFPHEVVGFSGGNKYFFPGIGGSQIINASHWLGALVTSYEIIGKIDTPVRSLINRAASLIPRPTYAICSVVSTHGINGVYLGDPIQAYKSAALLSSLTHIVWVDHPYKKVLSVMPSMYDDLWVGAKGMYKVEPVVSEGGEVIIFAPHISTISYTHGKTIQAVGYHVRDYFLKQWDAYKNYPLSILAHSTHVKGIGAYEDGIETPRIRVTLATGISEELCHRINLGYCDPRSINLEQWESDKDPEVLFIPRAGEDLYRLRPA
jgi:nickel-dependent lactate racemase